MRTAPGPLGWRLPEDPDAPSLPSGKQRKGGEPGSAIPCLLHTRREGPCGPPPGEGGVAGNAV